jgi:hypothetical protein
MPGVLRIITGNQPVNFSRTALGKSRKHRLKQIRRDKPRKRGVQLNHSLSKLPFVLNQRRSEIVTLPTACPSRHLRFTVIGPLNNLSHLIYLSSLTKIHQFSFVTDRTTVNSESLLMDQNPNSFISTAGRQGALFE